MFKWIDHIVIAVNNLEESQKDYETKLGVKPRGAPEAAPALGIRRVIFPLGQEGRFIELAEPLGPETPVGRSLARRGEGVHIVALAVEDKKQAANELKAKGVRVIEDGDGVFIHPRETHGVLYQLIERK